MFKKLLNVVCEIFKTLWRILVGFYLFSSSWVIQQKRQKELDPKYDLKKRLRRFEARFLTQERPIVKANLNKLSKRDKYNYVVFNYVMTCLHHAPPGASLKQTKQHLYECLHPFFMHYYGAYKLLQEALVNAGPGGGNPAIDRKKLLKYFESGVDIHEHAEKQMDWYRKEVIKIRRSFRADDKQKKSEETKEDIGRLEERRKNLKQDMKQLEKEIKNIDESIYTTAPEKAPHVKKQITARRKLGGGGRS